MRRIIITNSMINIMQTTFNSINNKCSSEEQSKRKMLLSLLNPF